MVNKISKDNGILLSSNLDFLIKIFLSDDPQNVTLAARVLFERLSVDQAIDLLERKIKHPKNHDYAEPFPLTLKIKRILILPEAKHILKELDPRLKLQVYSELTDPENFADEIIQSCQAAAQYDWILFLERIRWKTPKNGKLNQFFITHYLKIKPGQAFRQKSTINGQVHTNTIPINEIITYNIFDQFFRHIQSAVTPSSFKILWTADEVRKALTTEDVALAREWATNQFSRPATQNKDRFFLNQTHNLEKLGKLYLRRCYRLDVRKK